MNPALRSTTRRRIANTRLAYREGLDKTYSHVSLLLASAVCIKIYSATVATANACCSKVVYTSAPMYPSVTHTLVDIVRAVILSRLTVRVVSSAQSGQKAVVGGLGVRTQVLGWQPCRAFYSLLRYSRVSRSPKRFHRIIVMSTR